MPRGVATARGRHLDGGSSWLNLAARRLLPLLGDALYPRKTLCDTTCWRTLILRWRRLARHDIDRSGEYGLDLARLKHEEVDAIMPRLHAA